MHFSMPKLSSINFPITPLKNSSAFLHSAHKITFIRVAIAKYLSSFALRLVLDPTALVRESRSWNKLAETIKDRLMHFSPVVGAVSKDEESVLAFGLALIEPSFKILPIIEKSFASAVRHPGLPLSIVVRSFSGDIEEWEKESLVVFICYWFCVMANLPLPSSSSMTLRACSLSLGALDALTA